MGGPADSGQGLGNGNGQAPAAMAGTGNGNGTDSSHAGGVPDGVGANEFNITEFMVDANRDWLFKEEKAPHFMT